MMTIEAKIIDCLKDRQSKWTGLHIILLRFEKEEWKEAWTAVHKLAQSGVIEKEPHVQYHELTKTPMGMYYLYRYLEPTKPKLGIVE